MFIFLNAQVCVRFEVSPILNVPTSISAKWPSIKILIDGVARVISKYHFLGDLKFFPFLVYSCTTQLFFLMKIINFSQRFEKTKFF